MRRVPGRIDLVCCPSLAAHRRISIFSSGARTEQMTFAGLWDEWKDSASWREAEVLQPKAVGEIQNSVNTSLRRPLPTPGGVEHRLTDLELVVAPIVSTLFHPG
jgi:hypothetical protein